MSGEPWKDRLFAAYESWSLDDLRRVTERNFEFSKHLLVVSTGSFAAFSFLGDGVSFDNWFEVVGLVLLALSVVASIWIAEPPDFTIDGSEDLVAEHTTYSKRGKALRRLWLVFWLLGMTTVLLGNLVEAAVRSDQVTQANRLFSVDAC